MSLMNAERYTALRQAQAAAQSVVGPEGLATKIDIADLRTEMAELHTELRTEMAELRTKITYQAARCHASIMSG